MTQDQFLLYDHQKQIKLLAERVVFYLQGEIIEAVSESNEVYYLFFYKYQFLTAVKAIKLRRGSYIEHAFKEGMVFETPHPFMDGFLSSDSVFHMFSYKQLLKKIERHYSPQEQALILTFFESFFPKKELFKDISSKFYEYRRNGQMQLAYQIVRILMEFAPKQSLVKSLSNDIMFNKYAVKYSGNPEELLSVDSIFAEKKLYINKNDDQCLEQLKSYLKKEKRLVDVHALMIHKFISSPSAISYSEFKLFLEQHVKETEAVHILEQLSRQLPAFLPLQQDVFNIYMKIHNIRAALKVLQSSHLRLSKSQLQLFGDILEDFNSEAWALPPDVLNCVIKDILNLFPNKAEILVNHFVISLLKTKEPAFIKGLLQSLKEKHKDLKVYEKLDMMLKLSESLDEMQTLGELYYEFKQFEKAIECFSWEVELNPADPKPLQWLSKIYRQMGRIPESEVYQQLCINLRKWA